MTLNKVFISFCMITVGIFTVGVFYGSAFTEDTIVRASKTPEVNYKEEMITLIRQVSSYSKIRDHSFQVIGNNGLGLLEPEEVGDNSQVEFLHDVDGMLLESFFYGWEMNDDMETPASVRIELEGALAILKAHQRPVFNIDYCREREKVDKSGLVNNDHGIISFAADSRQLDRIPTYPSTIREENNRNITGLKQVKNLLVLLNPQTFADKESYLKSLRNTNYDLLIIDLYFNDNPLSFSDINSLKVKQNGGSRLVLAYMSVGEAEDYRPYWKPSWSKSLPGWIAEQNPDWPGNYKVKYWKNDWKNILFGSNKSYLDMILAAGFNGAFLDVIDAYQCFEK